MAGGARRQRLRGRRRTRRTGTEAHRQARPGLAHTLPKTYPQRGFQLPPDATDVLLIRHGASAAAVPGEPFELVEGQADPPLAAEGEEQAAKLAEWLTDEP